MCAKETQAVKEPEKTQGDAVAQGLPADRDPSSVMPNKTDHGEAVDILRQSIESQVTQIGKVTAARLAKQKKIKVKVPIDKLNPKDKHVVVGVNGWNFQIMRETPVVLPQTVYTLLVEGGYAPTVIP